jgi:hypothetical protein
LYVATKQKSFIFSILFQSSGSSIEPNELKDQVFDHSEEKNEEKKKEQMKLKLPGGGKVSEVYAFAGMHCILTHHTRAGLDSSSLSDNLTHTHTHNHNHIVYSFSSSLRFIQKKL